MRQVGRQRSGDGICAQLSVGCRQQVDLGLRVEDRQCQCTCWADFSMTKVIFRLWQSAAQQAEHGMAAGYGYRTDLPRLQTGIVRQLFCQHAKIRA